MAQGHHYYLQMLTVDCLFALILFSGYCIQGCPLALKWAFYLFDGFVATAKWDGGFGKGGLFGFGEVTPTCQL